MSNLETHLIIIKDIIKDAFKVIGGTFNEDSSQYMTIFNFLRQVRVGFFKPFKIKMCQSHRTRNQAYTASPCKIETCTSKYKN